VPADVNEDVLSAAADDLTGAGHQILGVLCDVSQEERSCFARIESSLRRHSR
jgi:hypothetical protein